MIAKTLAVIIANTAQAMMTSINVSPRCLANTGSIAHPHQDSGLNVVSINEDPRRLQTGMAACGVVVVT